MRVEVDENELRNLELDSAELAAAHDQLAGAEQGIQELCQDLEDTLAKLVALKAERDRFLELLQFVVTDWDRILLHDDDLPMVCVIEEIRTVLDSAKEAASG